MAKPTTYQYQSLNDPAQQLPASTLAAPNLGHTATPSRVPACYKAGVSSKVKAVHTTGGTTTRISNSIALARQPFPVGGPVRMCYNLSAPTLLATIPLDSGHQVLPCPTTSFADHASRLATNLVPAFQSGHAATPPKRITTMPDRFTGETKGTSATLPCPERMTSQRHQVRECSELLAVLGYGQQALTESAPRLMANPAALPFTTPLRGYWPTASLRRYLDHHSSESSL